MSYQLQQYIATAIETVLAANQTYVVTANVQKNRDTTTSTVPRFEVEVGNVARASGQMMKIQAGDSTSNILVYGLVYDGGSTTGNGTYLPDGTLNGRTRWRINGTIGNPQLFWSGTQWTLDPLGSIIRAVGTNATTWPWQETNWTNLSDQPTVVELPKFVYNHFTADAQVSLVTERGSATNHAQAVARTRYLFSQEAQSFVSPVVTVFEVLSIEPTSEAQDVNEDAREDWSRLGFRFEIGLIPGGYVVPSAG